MRILGIDGGLRNCGFAVGDCDGFGQPIRVLDLGANTTDSDRSLVMRSDEFNRDFDLLMTHWQPQVVVIEAASFPRSAKATAMGWVAYGIVIGRCRSGSASDLGALLITLGGRSWRDMLGLPRPPKGLTLSQAHSARKASTRAAMQVRYPGAEALLASTPGDMHEHAWDALAIMTAWTVKATSNTAAKAA